MRRILYFVACLLLAAACQGKPREAGFIVQVSLGGWHSPDYTAEQVISRIGEVSAKIPVEKVIIGWSLDQDIYRQVGEYLHADFIKPMLYRQTFAPAGMGFEYDLLKQAVPGAEGYPAFAMDVDFLDSQLQAMEPYACGKYPGIEINYREKVAPTSPEYVTESLDAVLRHGFDGAVLSWNIMQAPDSHISCLGKR